MTKSTSETPPENVGSSAEQQNTNEKKGGGKVLSKAASAVSVISGYRYYSRAIAQTGRAAKLPILRSGLKDVKKQIDSHRKGAETVAAEELSEADVQRSLVGHALILAVLVPAGLIALLISVHGFGLLFRHGLWIQNGYYGTVTGTAFFFFALARGYVSAKSVHFFWQVKQIRNQEAAANDTFL